MGLGFTKNLSGAGYLIIVMARLVNNITQYCSSMLEHEDQYQLVSGLFLKLLALVYFAAFFSLGGQITGLVGDNGILPLTALLDYSYQNNGILAWLYQPNIFWFDSSNLSLQLACWSGCVVAVLLFVGIKPVWSLIALFVLYLSLYHAGQTFLTFQWDTLLLESGFLAIFVTRGPSQLLLFMFHWLLFRLRFMSGISKLASDDPSWWNLTTLNYYFETQPLPHFGAWYFHQLPEWILQGGVLLVYFTELIVPFFIFLPRKYRLFAAVTTIVMQCLIIATSNHNWINLLTIVLCLFLLDDDIVKKIVPRRFIALITVDKPNNAKQHIGSDIVRRNFVFPVFAFIILFCSVTTFTMRFTNADVPALMSDSTAFIRSWGVGHIFHVFPTMQTERHELEVEGSYDGIEWKAYGFKYKPSSLEKMPAFIVPHQPRLDWMIWFVPPKHFDMLYWFDAFLYRLHQGSSDVIDLLEHNPFADKPPSYLRVLVYKYKFTSVDEKSSNGRWWSREYLGEFPYVEGRSP